MNIFFLDRDLKKCVSYYVKSHVTKMPLEYCQLLSTALRLSDSILVETECKENHKKGIIRILEGESYSFDSSANRFYISNPIAYKSTHINHPCSIWVRESLSHWNWLKELSMALRDEFYIRRGSYHSSSEVTRLLPTPKNLKDHGWLRDSPQAMPDQYKWVDTVEAYRRYYRGEKSRLADWECRNIPDWWSPRN